ncbi:MAG TPA: hypothetical protein VMK42_10800 [Anaeromyxobacteraceae bacterium]|nr:hypothetical protein [Anaeromyxobacteraceae bacterium]
MARSRRPPSGVPPLLAGFLFGGAGLALLVAAAGRSLEAPPLLLAAFAAVFLGGGALVALHGWRSAARSRALSLHPEEPWRFDRDWDPAGALDEAGATGRRALSRAIALAAFLLPFNAAAALQPEGIPPVLVGILDLGPPLLAGRALALRLGRRRYGTSRLRFDRFPYLLGEPFAATLELGQRAPLVRALEVTLRCEERRPAAEPGPALPGGTDVELYRATQVVHGARRLALRFELPSASRPMGTDLSATSLRRWWLTVRGEATGVRYDATFAVPIYAPPVPTISEGIRAGPGKGAAPGP